MRKCVLNPEQILLALAAYALFSVPVFGAEVSFAFPLASAHAGQHDVSRQDVPQPLQKGAMDWEGNISSQSEELLIVITSKKEWAALWSRAFNRPAPEVDFNTYAIACVFLGYNARWLYDIHIGDPRESGNMLVIPYGLSEIMLRLSGPFRASGQYRMKGVQKNKGYEMMLEMMEGSVRGK